MSQQSIRERIMSRTQSNDSGHSAVDDQMKPRRDWVKTAMFSLLAIAVVGAAGYVGSRFEDIRNLFSQSAVAQAKEANPPVADSPFLQHAKQAGLQACSTVFPALGELLTTGSQYAAQSYWNSQSPDEHAVQALVGMEYASQNYSGTAAGIVFAAPTESACEGTLVRVSPFSMPCADIPSILPTGSKVANNLGKVAVYELGGGQGNALLLPTGNTCVVISVASVAQ